MTGRLWRFLGRRAHGSILSWVESREAFLGNAVYFFNANKDFRSDANGLDLAMRSLLPRAGNVLPQSPMADA